MSKIKSKNTKPELIIRKKLWHKGYRYRLHKKDLPGKPDLVFSKYKVVIFVNGCFWHRHGCKYTTTPKTRTEFWEKKFKQNIERDKRNISELKKAGWRVLTLWECEIKENVDKVVSEKVIPFLLNEKQCLKVNQGNGGVGKCE